MERLIKKLRNNRKVIFDKGGFDAWCVYFVEKDGRKVPPYDIDYFSDLKGISRVYDYNKVYNDFISIYKLTNKQVDDAVLDLIDSLALTYDSEHQTLIEQWFTVIYAGMIAEENKEHTKLGKRIKRLGVTQLLIDSYSAFDAANFSKGKKWQELDKIMFLKGF